MAKILVVEDDATLGLSVATSLELAGHVPHIARTIAAARQAVEADEPHLILLDLGLPDGDGLELLAEIRRAGSTTPVVILTARGTLDSRVAGLRRGADDYVAKPFDMPELIARVDALLRRRDWGEADPAPEADPGVVRVGRLEIDFGRHEALRDGERVPLTALEMKLVAYLLRRRGKVVRREDLLRDVWGLSDGVRTRTVDVFVSRLRKLVEDDPAAPTVIMSVRGVGYRLEPEPERAN